MGQTRQIAHIGQIEHIEQMGRIGGRIHIKQIEHIERMGQIRHK